MIAIKGMDMPKRCADCRFCIRQETNDYGSYGQCMVTNCETVDTLTLSPDCILTEIVTCKDCKHCERRYDGTGKQTLYMCEDEHCNDGTAGCEMVVEPDFFCEYGEKMYERGGEE